MPTLAIGLFVGACDSGSPRVTVVNDTADTQHVFYCSNTSCSEGVSGNDAVLKPGDADGGYWNSEDAAGQVGVATYPGDLLLGCLDNPSPGVADPPSKTLKTSSLVPCGPTPVGSRSQVKIVNP